MLNRNRHQAFLLHLMTIALICMLAARNSVLAQSSAYDFISGEIIKNTTSEAPRKSPPPAESDASQEYPATGDKTDPYVEPYSNDNQPASQAQSGNVGPLDQQPDSSRPSPSPDGQPGKYPFEKKDGLPDSATQSSNVQKGQSRPGDELFEPKIKPFGYDFFDKSTQGFQPLSNLPPPAEYPLGPGDSLRVIFTSTVGEETDLRLTVDPTGRIHIPAVGFVSVSGLTIAKAQTAISNAAKTKFPHLSAQASVNSIRPIQVFVIGEVKKPGSYVLPGLSSLLNALYMAGGPNLAGSLRAITVQRNKKTVATIDLYSLLMYGNRDKDIMLQSGDSVFVNAVGPTVTVQGEVRRQAVFEMLGPTTVREAIAMAGGATGRASLSSVRIERVVGGSRKFIVDLSLTSPNASDWDFPLQNGDDIQLSTVLKDAVNRVEILGQVRRPGKYEHREGMTLSQLVARAEGFTDEEIFLDRATILRTREDGTSELLSTNLGQAMAHTHDQDILIQPRDKVIIFARGEASALDRTVTISGEIKRPSVYDRKEGMRVRDLIIAAGGAKEEANQTLELARTNRTTGVTQSLMVNLDKAMAGVESDNVLLADGDQVSVRSIRDAKNTAEMVTLSGEVNVPGTYALLHKGERLSSVIARAGGLSPDAFPDGAIFVRKQQALISERQIEIASGVQLGLKTLSDQLRDLQMAQYGVVPKTAPAPVTVPSGMAVGNSGAAAAAAAAGIAHVATEAHKSSTEKLGEISLEAPRTIDVVTKQTRLPINLQACLENPGQEEDIQMDDGDTITIPRQPVMVSVAGAVTNPSVVVYKEGQKADYYVKRVGGYSRDNDSKNTVVVRANGEVVRLREVGTIKLGDIIIVPSKAMTVPKNKWESVGEFARVLGNLAIAVAVVRR